MRLKGHVRKGLAYRFDIFVVDEGKHWRIENEKLWDGLVVGAESMCRQERFLENKGHDLSFD